LVVLCGGPGASSARDRIEVVFVVDSVEVNMGFVQIIEFRTSKMDEMRKVGDEWEAAAGPDRKALRVVVAADRDDPGRYFNIVFFDSYESAMENSNLPQTQELSQKMMALGDGPPKFYNLDIVDDRN
jgi:hypothetical protein